MKRTSAFLIALLITATSMAQIVVPLTGQYTLTRKTAGGFAQDTITPLGTNFIRWNGSGRVTQGKPTISDVTSLQATLDAKAALAHLHPPSDLTGFGASGGYLRSNGSAWVRVSGITWPDVTGTPTGLSGYGITDAQGLDADLTLIAALATTGYGRSFLTLADAAAARTYIGAGTGSGTVTGVTGTSPIASSGGTAPDISIANAAADGSTKGAASFTGADFNASSGNISLDYTNGQAASGSAKGYLTAADWTTFNGKQSVITFGTGVQTALGVNVGSAGAFVVNGGALGTPSSGTATNLTGTAAGLTAGTVTTNANLTGVVTSVGNATSIANAALSIAKTSGLQTALDGKVVGPASATDNAFVMYDGTTGKLIKNGLVGSTGGNGVADAGKPVIFEAAGSIKVTAGTYGLQATCGSGQVGVSAQASDDGTASEGYSDTGWGGYWYSNSNIGSVGHSISGIGAWGVSQDSTGVYASSAFNIPLYVKAGNPSHDPDIAWFVNTDDEGVYIENDGGLEWTSLTGAATTRTELGLGNVENTALSTWAGSTNITTVGTVTTGTWNADAVPVANGGTGAASALGARSNLGLGTIATQDANSVTITGGSVTGITDITVADGGTGSSTAAGARTNLGTAPLDATYITQTANSELSGEQALGSLATGILKNTTTTGVLSIAVAGDFPTLNQNTSGNAATVTTNANLTGPITSVGNATTVADGELASIAGLTSAADKVPQFTGSGTAALVDLKLGTATAYGGTITWTAGAAPSGTANLTQYYTRVGNLVTWHIDLTYANAGTTVTNFTLTFPTEFPTPSIPTGFTGANVWIWDCFGTKILTTPSGTIAGANLAAIRRNAADTGFEIQHSAFTSGTYRTFLLSGTYFTQ